MNFAYIRFHFAERELVILRKRFCKTLKYLLYPVIIITAAGNCTCQERSNLEIFDREITGQLERIIYKPDLRRDVQFIFSVRSAANDENEAKFIVSLIKKTAERNRIWASFSEDIVSGDSVYNRFIIDIHSLSTKYPGFASNKFLGTKTVKREISGMLRVQASGVNYNYAGSDSVIISVRDNVSYDDIDNIESNDYKFTKSKPPRVSFYEEIVFPAAVLTVSVAAAILFFIIRSK